MLSPLWTDQLSAWSSFATALLTFLLLVSALWAGSIAIKTMRASQEASKAATEANEQARRDSIEQTRPYVYVEITPSLAGPSTFDVRITNVGKSSARGLTMTFSDWPDPLDDVAILVKRMFETPRTLPPNCSIRSLWRLTGNFTDGTSVAGMGESGRICLFYTSDDPSQPQYADEFDVLIQASGLWPVPESGPSPEAMTGDARLFYKLGQTIARRIGEISR